MSDAAKLYTQRAVIERERAAFKAGRVDRARTGEMTGEAAEARAVEMYPLPKVTRPVVMEVLGENYELRVVKGVPEYRNHAGCVWATISTFGAPRLSVNGARVLVALLANPTEEVDA